MPVMLEHARDFVSKRLAPADPPDDGRQTPPSRGSAIVNKSRSG
ncbi:MAG: DUF4186 family protein [Verrucomicrobiaceae bacterium]|nr:MAG: DUF4186 family protein [Verrucomicrobiaceae bacterium]